ncbi:MAG: hypothetical protein IJG38_07275 [Thermoguttaceae bacterium]|nr:hypothetical protein [Thermoguttaceae bacterium]
MSQDKIESRRDFMKKFGKLAGAAAVAAAFMSTGSNKIEAKNINNPKTVIDCEGTCVMSCVDLCIGNCEDMCGGSCKHSCADCYGTCLNTCYRSCKGNMGFR